jgi:hypothetical protein
MSARLTGLRFRLPPPARTLFGVDERHLRQARNEALLREVNERVVTLDRGPQTAWANGTDERFAVQCECGRAPSCGECISLTLAEYDEVRAQADRFLVLPGHEDPAIEHVVRRNDRYLVVDKIAQVELEVGGDGVPTSGG